MAKQERTYVKPGRTTASRDMQEKIHTDTKTRSQEESEAIKAVGPTVWRRRYLNETVQGCVRSRTIPDTQHRPH